MKLLACPMCGTEARWGWTHVSGHRAWVYCPNRDCAVTSNPARCHRSKAEALAEAERRWNTRVAGPVTETMDWVQEWTGVRRG